MTYVRPHKLGTTLQGPIASYSGRHEINKISSTAAQTQTATLPRVAETEQEKFTSHEVSVQIPEYKKP